MKVTARINHNPVELRFRKSNRMHEDGYYVTYYKDVRLVLHSRIWAGKLRWNAYASVGIQDADEFISMAHGSTPTKALISLFSEMKRDMRTREWQATRSYAKEINTLRKVAEALK